MYCFRTCVCVSIRCLLLICIVVHVQRCMYVPFVCLCPVFHVPLCVCVYPMHVLLKSHYVSNGCACVLVPSWGCMCWWRDWSCSITGGIVGQALTLNAPVHVCLCLSDHSPFLLPFLPSFCVLTLFLSPLLFFFCLISLWSSSLPLSLSLSLCFFPLIFFVIPSIVLANQFHFPPKGDSFVAVVCNCLSALQLMS